MSDFIAFKVAVKAQFDLMTKQPCFRAPVTAEQLKSTYLGSFAPGTNEVFREAREYDCTYCHHFMRDVGNMVAVIDGEMQTVWDVEVPAPFQAVANAMSTFIIKKVVDDGIKDVFLHQTKSAGVDCNRTEINGEVVKFNHFHVKIPKSLVVSDGTIASKLSEKRSTHDVFQRALDEVSQEAVEIVQELIAQNSLYRGQQYSAMINQFLEVQREYAEAGDRTMFAWLRMLDLPDSITRIRSSAIGTLICDIAEGTELEDAVRKFEAKVAPENYKRPTALITKGMIDKAEKKIAELGLTSALPRRHARTEDVKITNVLFADRSAKQVMEGSVFDDLKSEIPEKGPKLDKVEEVSVEKFLTDILPKAEGLELMVDNKHAGNFVSLIAPQYEDAPKMFQWDNRFSWSYAGEVTDAMKENVKAAGGSVTGVLRFSIQWNDEFDNKIDFDAHCYEPDGDHIYHGSRTGHHSSGNLDVDIISPGNKVAVENITWPDLDRMQTGRYKFNVENYASNTSNRGFKAQLEYNGTIYEYVYTKRLKGGQRVPVAEIEFHPETGIKFIKALESTQSVREIWGIKTQSFQKVNLVMNSPNYWDGQGVGNQHVFFVLEGCKQEGDARGFYNEFLTNDLREHRKVLEVLGSRMRAPASDEQLSGVGFSLTVRNSVLCRVQGAFNRVIKINF